MKPTATTKTITVIFPLLLVLYEMATYLSNDMYLPALPAMMRDLQLSHELAQATLTAWFLGSASIQLILGPLSDRYGRRPVLLIGGVLYVIASVICAATSNITLLLIGRFFQGVTVCSVVVAGYASIHELLDHHQAITTLAWMASIVLLAPAFGPLLGSLVLYIGSWRLIFLILAIWAAIVLALLFRTMPESRPPALAHSLSLRLLLRQYWLIITCRGFMMNTLVFCLSFSAMIAWLTAGPFLIIDKLGLSAMDYGLLQACIFSTFIIAVRLIKPLLGRLGTQKLITVGLTITLIGGISAVIVTQLFPQSLTGLISTLMVFNAGAGLSSSSLNRTAIEASSQPMGARIAVFSSIMSVFGVLGTLAATVFYTGEITTIAFIFGATGLSAILIRLFSKYC